MTECLDDEGRRNRILPIGGPGPAITPREQAEYLFDLIKTGPRISRVPIALLDVIIVALWTLGRLIPSLAEKAELARIGRYYATESMLVLDRSTCRYDADLTPSTGSDTLHQHYARLINRSIKMKQSDHSVF